MEFNRINILNKKRKLEIKKNLGLESKKDIKKGFYVVTWNKLNFFPWRNGITIYSYEPSRNKELESEISTNSCGFKKKKGQLVQFDLYRI